MPKRIAFFFSFIHKLYKILQHGWKGISIFIYTDITQEPKKFKLNFYSLLFPFLLFFLLLIFLIYDRLETVLYDKKANIRLENHQILIRNLYYSLEIRKNQFKRIRNNLKNIYIQYSTYREVFSEKDFYKTPLQTTKIEEEIQIAQQLHNITNIILRFEPKFFLANIWHKAYIYSIIPKGIPMYPGTFSITSGFGNRQDPFHQLNSADFHNGIDFAAAKNTPILAVTDGRVLKVFKDTDSGYGVHVIIHHGLGFLTLYAHCTDILVNENQFVRENQIIALVGKTGRATGNHLHYEVRIGNSPPIDPLPFIRLK